MSFYEGWLYGTVMNRIQRKLNAFLARQVEPGQRVLEVGCGTANLTVPLARRAGEVVAVELSPAMIHYARRRVAATDLDNISLVHGDITTALRDEPTEVFDAALMVLVLHEMPQAVRQAALREVIRLARRAVVVDFVIPQPGNLAGYRNLMFERLAGTDHFAAFCDYRERAGTSGIAEAMGLECRAVREIDGGSLGLWELGGAQAPA